MNDEARAAQAELAKVREALKATENAAEVTRRLNEKLLDQLHEARKTIEKLKAVEAPREASVDEPTFKVEGTLVDEQGFIVEAGHPQEGVPLWHCEGAALSQHQVLEQIRQERAIREATRQGKTKCGICGAPDRETCGHWIGKL